MNIIFLDFDGVMDTASYDMYLVKNHYSECDDNGRPYFDPKCIANKKKIIDETGADIVISSDWKYIDSHESLLNMWKQRNLPGHMIDVTPNVSKHRGTEIAKWLEKCDTDYNYTIIDDLDADNFTGNQQSKLVVVNPWSGLDEEATNRAIVILKSQETNKDKNKHL